MMLGRRFPWRLLCVAVGILPVVACAIFITWSLELSQAMHHKYDQIQRGMTLAEVRAVMEAEPTAQLETVNEDWYFDIWTWRLGFSHVEIQFTQPPSRADEKLPDEAIAQDGLATVWFKEIDQQGAGLWEYVRRRYYDLVNP